MLKRIFSKMKYFRCLDNYPEFNPGSFLVAIFCVMLMIIATFTQLPLWLFSMPDAAFINPSDFFANIKSHTEFMKTYSYIPQIPSVLFTAALLGPRIGLLTVFIYILIGLLNFPIFASGGGLGYCTERVFGYLFSYFIAVYLVGNIMSARITSFSILRATFVGVFSIHVFGILYLIVIMLLNHNPISAIFGWIWALSGIQLPYDLLIGYVAISLARPARTLFWIVMD